MRKRSFFYLLIILAPIFLFSGLQKYQEEALAINISVPVRVFDGQNFIENLTKEDFLVYEDGVPQPITAVYLIKKTRIIHQEVEKPRQAETPLPSPNLARRIVLVFEINEFLPKCEEAVDFLIKEALQPQDKLTVITPVRAYNLKGEALQRLSREAIARQLKEKIRQDIWRVNVELRNLISDYKTLMNSQWRAGISGQDILYKIKNLKFLDEKQLIKFAEVLKNFDGQKHLFLFYQEEELLMKKIFDDTGQSEFQKMQFIKDIRFDVQKIKRLFADYGVHFNFLFITKVKWSNQLMDVTEFAPQQYENFKITGEFFSVFYNLAKATGGVTLSSQNPEAAFKKAVEVAENYYLLYYRPLNYQADGKFRQIKVVVRNRNYKVIHRLGYVAD